jgi:hypothetical protein
MREKNIQSDILLKFGALPGMRIWRVNTGKAYGYSVIANALARAGQAELLQGLPLTKYGTPGTPDIHGILEGGRYLAIEVKRPGQELEDEQKAWRRMFEGLGGLYIEGHSTDEVARAIRQAGII